MTPPPKHPPVIPLHIVGAIRTMKRFLTYTALAALLAVASLLVWTYSRAKHVLAAQLVGTWYPRMTFIPRAGTSVWELRADGKAIRHYYIDENDAAGPIVKPKDAGDSAGTWSLDKHYNIILGNGLSRSGFRIVGLTPAEVVLVDLDDHSQPPFEQRFGRQCAWHTEQ